MSENNDYAAINKRIRENSWWYRNCKRQRKARAKICDECPIRFSIELLESQVHGGNTP